MRFSMQRGVPSTELLPAEQLRAAAQRAMTDIDDLLLYGDPAGHEALREWFGARLKTESDRIVITNGSLHGLQLTASVLHPERPWIGVEAPTYDFALAILRRTGCRLVGFDRDDGDLDLGALLAEIRLSGPPRLLYLIPTFQNPAGGTLSTETRRRVVALAREHDFPIVEDDPYRSLSFGRRAPPTIHALARDQVVLMTSLSKTVAPGLRVGALALPAAPREQLRRLASETYISPGRFAQGVALAYCCSESYESHVARTATTLAARADALAASLNAELGTDYQSPAGGYFLWVPAPGADAERAVALAASKQVLLQPGTPFFLDDRGRGFLRLSYASTPAESMPILAARLRAAWSSLEAVRFKRR